MGLVGISDNYKTRVFEVYTHARISMNNNQIVLINPNQMKPVVAPLALEYLSPALIGAGFVVDILDFAFIDHWSEDQPKSWDFGYTVALRVAEYFAQNTPLAIGITIRNTDDCYYASQDFILVRTKCLVETIKQHSDAPIVLGGVAFSGMPEAIMRYLNVDFGIVGEGEAALPQFLQCLRVQSDFASVPGLIYKTSDGYRHNPIEYLDISQLSLSTRNAIDNLRYFTEGGMAGFETKRGCNQRCIYCLDPISKGRTIRLRHPKDVADELECLLEGGITHFHTCDSEFNIPEHHAQAVCEELIRRQLGEKIQWYAYASPVPFSDNLALLMKRAGCVGIDFGADHANDVILKRLKRNFTADDLRRTAQICHRHDITFMYDLLLGGPGENQATLKETIDMMRQIRPSRVGVALGVRIYPGTEMAAIVRAEGVDVHNKNLRGRIEDNPDFLEPIFYLSADLGAEPESYVANLVDGDSTFFFASLQETGQNYNYNENSMLVQAIKAGYRGAFWDILRRLSSRNTQH